MEKEIASASVTPVTETPSSEKALSTRSRTDSEQANENGVAVVGEAQPERQNWNNPKINILRVIGCYCAMIVIGLNDGVLGTLIPHMQTYYGISYGTVSWAFLSPIVGFILAAFTNKPLSYRFGRRGNALIAPMGRIIGFSILVARPSFPAAVVAYAFSGFGCGHSEGAYNAWLSSLGSGQVLLGGMHGFWGVGSLIGPNIATAFVTHNLPWYQTYWVLFGAAILEVLVAGPAFWSADSAALHKELREQAAAEQRIEDEKIAKEKEEAKEKARVEDLEKHAEAVQVTDVTVNAATEEATPADSKKEPEGLRGVLLSWPLGILGWVCVLWYGIYAGHEVGTAGWIPSYMLEIKNAPTEVAGLAVMGWNLGMTVGRFFLWPITRLTGLTLYWAIALYMVVCGVLHLLWWLIPNTSYQFVAVMLAFEGVFCGPVFPLAVAHVVGLVPYRLRIPLVTVCVTMGRSGAALLPFAIGAIAEDAGTISVLPPIGFAFLCGIFAFWFLIPRKKVWEPSWGWWRR